jgi:hypothetical protein
MIWEHHILPIPLKDDLYLNIVPAEYMHIAVTADHELFRALTRAEFNTCCRLGEFFLGNRGCVVTKAPKLDALKNKTRPNISLDIALKAVAANGEIPVNLNDLLDNHYYVTVPVLTTVIICILIAAIVAAIIIKRLRVEARAVRQTVSYQNQALIITQETVRNLENSQDECENRPRKLQAPQPPPTAPFAPLTMTEKPPRVPPLYATASPPGQPEYSLGVSQSLAADMLGTAAATAGHSLDMPHGLAANMLGFQTGRDQAPVRNFPGAAPGPRQST